MKLRIYSVNPAYLQGGSCAGPPDYGKVDRFARFGNAVYTLILSVSRNIGIFLHVRVIEEECTRRGGNGVKGFDSVSG